MISKREHHHTKLLSQYDYVADDILRLCKPSAGIWLDVVLTAALFWGACHSHQRRRAKVL